MLREEIKNVKQKIKAMKIQIEITKDVIDRSLLCGTENSTQSLVSNCALGVAYNDLIPNVAVCRLWIEFMTLPLHPTSECKLIAQLNSTKKQQDFVFEFDLMSFKPELRYSLVGQKFNVEIPDKVIEYWYQDAAIIAQKIADSSCLSIAEECNAGLLSA